MLYKSIFNTVAVAVAAFVLLSGCGGDNNPANGGNGGLVGDWSVVETRWEMDGDGGVDKISDYRKLFYSFKSSGDLTVTQMHKIGNLWIESVYNQKYIIKGDYLCAIYEDGEGIDDDCVRYSISGNTLTLNDTYEDCGPVPPDDAGGLNRSSKCDLYSNSVNCVRVNIANVKNSLQNVYSRDPLLNDTRWRSEYGDYLEFHDDHIHDDSRKYIYVDDYDDNARYNTWYTERSRLTLMELGCDQYDWDYGCSVTRTVTLDYQLADGTLRLRAAGGSWEMWTNAYNYSQSKSRAERGKHAVSPFKALRRQFLASQPHWFSPR